MRTDDLRITDHRYGVTLPLWQCRQCGFIFADSADLGRLTSLYESLVDAEYRQSQQARVLQMRWLLRQARGARPAAASLLDVGAASGLLVAEARRLGLQALGIEPSRSLVQAARQANGVELIEGVLPHESLTGKTFDLVFLVDVLEHVADPVGLLRHSAQVLSPEGVGVVVTPDVGSLAARLLGRRWWHYRAAHVCYFNRRSLARAVAASGLTTTRRFRAKWFFHVGYLAERLAEYLPCGWLNRLARRVRLLRWVYRRVVPVNLHDSFVVLLEHQKG